MILNLGWYKLDAKQSRYSRSGGHYVTVAGYVSNPSDLDKSELDTKLVIHDPSPRSKEESKYCDLDQIKNGILVRAPLVILGDGYSELDGIDIQPGADVAVVDGAFAFGIERR